MGWLFAATAIIGGLSAWSQNRAAKEQAEWERARAEENAAEQERLLNLQYEQVTEQIDEQEAEAREIIAANDAAMNAARGAQGVGGSIVTAQESVTGESLADLETQADRARESRDMQREQGLFSLSLQEQNVERMTRQINQLNRSAPWDVLGGLLGGGLQGATISNSFGWGGQSFASGQTNMFQPVETRPYGFA